MLEPEDKSSKGLKLTDPFQQLVINRLDRIDATLENHTQEHTDIRSDITSTKEEITKLKTKSSFWGALSGAATALLAYMFSGGSHNG